MHEPLLALAVNCAAGQALIALPASHPSFTFCRQPSALLAYRCLGALCGCVTAAALLVPGGSQHRPLCTLVPWYYVVSGSAGSHVMSSKNKKKDTLLRRG